MIDPVTSMFLWLAVIVYLLTRPFPARPGKVRIEVQSLTGWRRTRI